MTMQIRKGQTVAVEKDTELSSGVAGKVGEVVRVIRDWNATRFGFRALVRFADGLERWIPFEALSILA